MQNAPVEQNQNAPVEHSAVILICIEIPHGFHIFVLSIFEWLLKTGFTVVSICPAKLVVLGFEGDSNIEIT